MESARTLRIALAVYTAGIIVVSLIPGGQGLPLFPHADKVGHFLAYTGLGVLACLTFESRRARVLALVAAIALGASLEVAQHFVPRRSMSLADETVNALGVLTGALLFRWRERELRTIVARITGGR